MSIFINGRPLVVAGGKDPLIWFPTKADFPVPGEINSFYGALDTQIVYFWDTDKVAYASHIKLSEKGAQFGVAELDVLTRLKYNQLPLEVLKYAGEFNPDMFEWRVSNFASDNAPMRAAKNDSMIVAVGGGGLISRSTNGVDWINSTIGTANRSSIVWSEDKNLFVAAQHSAPARVNTSSDGVNWNTYTDTSGFPGVIIGMAYGNGRFVGVGYAGSVISTDGINWTWHTLFMPVMLMGFGVVFAEDRFVSVGFDGQIATSVDGVTWELKNSPVTETMTNVVYGKDRLVASCENGSIIYSEDLGETWTEVVLDPTDNMKGINFGRNKFIVCGKKTSYQSLDGVTWTHLPMDPDSEGNPDNYYEDTIYGGTLYQGFIALGKYKNGGTTVGRIVNLNDAEKGVVYKAVEDISFEGYDLKKDNLIFADDTGWVVFNPQVKQYTEKTGEITSDILINKEISLEHEPDTENKVMLFILGYPRQLQDQTFTVAENVITLSDDLVSILKIGVPYKVFYWR